MIRVKGYRSETLVGSELLHIHKFPRTNSGGQTGEQRTPIKVAYSRIYNYKYISFGFETSFIIII